MADLGQHEKKQGGATLILGGARSGKSCFALDLAETMGGDDVLFVATAKAGDDEMSERIEKHRNSRPTSWETLECTLNVGESLLERETLPRVILVDCLTMLVSNVMLRNWDSETDPEDLVADEADGLLRVAAEGSSHLLIVSGEVGSGVVPDSAMGRRFRDLLGFANQQVASSSVATYLMIAGFAVDVRRLATSVTSAAQNDHPIQGIGE